MPGPLVAIVTALPLEATAGRDGMGIERDVEASASNLVVSHGVVMVEDAITAQRDVATPPAREAVIAEWPDAYFIFVGMTGEVIQAAGTIAAVEHFVDRRGDWYEEQVRRPDASTASARGPLSAHHRHGSDPRRRSSDVDA